VTPAVSLSSSTPKKVQIALTFQITKRREPGIIRLTNLYMRLLVGNWDMVGNNTPVFFIRDPSKFPGRFFFFDAVWIFMILLTDAKWCLFVNLPLTLKFRPPHPNRFHSHTKAQSSNKLL
jgi:hypothetical protein